MKIHLNLTLDERTALFQVSKKHGVNTDNLLQKWSFFVAQIEQGYSDSIYEYTNDLSVRDILEKVLRDSSETLRGKINQALQPWDERFNKATRKVSRALAPGVKSDAPSWWYRVPNKLKKELEDDLISEGILS